METALASGADINTKAEFNETALNIAASAGNFEIVKLLVEKGADVENKGGADMTPLMQAALPSTATAEHDKIVTYLINKGAVISDDLLSSVQLKVNILTENSEAGMVLPQAVEAWKGFLNYLYAARIKQDLPKIVESLSDKSIENRKGGVKSVQKAVWNGIDISSVIPSLTKLLSDEDKDIRYYSSTSLCTQYMRNKNTKSIKELAENKDDDVKEGVVYVLFSFAKAAWDVSFAFQILEKFMSEKNDVIKHDAAVSFGYAVMNTGIDISFAFPTLIKLLVDENAQMRADIAWVFYRAAEKGLNISIAISQLEKLATDTDQKVKDIAEKALSLSKQNKK